MSFKVLKCFSQFAPIHEFSSVLNFVFIYLFVSFAVVVFLLGGGGGGGGGAGNLLGFFFFFFNFDRLLSPFVGLATWCREVKFDVNFA